MRTYKSGSSYELPLFFGTPGNVRRSKLLPSALNCCRALVCDTMMHHITVNNEFIINVEKHPIIRARPDSARLNKKAVTEG